MMVSKTRTCAHSKYGQYCGLSNRVREDRCHSTRFCSGSRRTPPSGSLSNNRPSPRYECIIVTRGVHIQSKLERLRLIELGSLTRQTSQSLTNQQYRLHSIPVPVLANTLSISLAQANRDALMMPDDRSTWLDFNRILLVIINGSLMSIGS